MRKSAALVKFRHQMTLEAIKARIQEGLAATHVEVIDLGGGDHIRAIVVSPKFAGLPLLKQHKLVMVFWVVKNTKM